MLIMPFYKDLRYSGIFHTAIKHWKTMCSGYGRPHGVGGHTVVCARVSSPNCADPDGGTGA